VSADHGTIECDTTRELSSHDICVVLVHGKLQPASDSAPLPKPPLTFMLSCSFLNMLALRLFAYVWIFSLYIQFDVLCSDSELHYHIDSGPR
jgi:hypothetical protein